MSEYNSAKPFKSASLADLQEAFGAPQFLGASSTDWYLVFNGLIVQGGIVELPAAATTFSFVTAFTKQVLGVFLQPMTIGQTPAVTSTTLADFTANHGGVVHNAYWWAVGV